MKRISEIIRSMRQGATQAVLCRSTEGVQYVVKTRRSGRETMVKEWVFGRIGHELGLPIPPIEIVVFDDPIQAKHAILEEARALAESPGFASKWVESVSTFDPASVSTVPPELRRSILLFDWWILNDDRTDENPNLLWGANIEQLHVIDHNLAMSSDAPEEFWERHIFRGDRSALSDRAFRVSSERQMEGILRRLPDFWQELPEAWTDQLSRPTYLETAAMLERFHEEDFWRPA